jgi:putative ABC transport system substrate-binding protein
LIDGLRQGLRELGVEEGKHLILDIRDTKNDLKAAGEAARDLEAGKVALIFTVSTSITTEAKRATTQSPLVFYVGADPVRAGLVKSLARPGGRLTGVYGHTSDLTAKRMEILKEIVPRLRRVLTIYNPDNPLSREGVQRTRDAARQQGVQLIERHARSPQELRLALEQFKPVAGDAFFHSPDALVISHADVIIEAARAKRMPTMFNEVDDVARGALAGYGQNNREIGRLSAKYVQRILTGTPPGDVPVESYSKIELAVNVRTAREIGLTMPQSVRVRANTIIE